MTHDNWKLDVLWAILKSPWLLSMFIVFVLTVIAFSFLAFVSTDKTSPSYTYEKDGDTFYREAKYEEAVSSWQKTLNIEPRNTRIINKIGIAYLESNNIVKEYEYYAEKCEAYPKNLDLRYNFAIACFKKEDLGRCREELDKIYRINPYFPRLYYLEGLIYEKEGDLVKAQAEYVKEINMNPETMGAWYKIKQLEKNQENAR